MTDEDLALLHRELDLATYLTRKPGVSGASLGLVPLDSWSGLFLERGAEENQWVLEGRTWDQPPDSLVHEWHVRAALAAQELDPTVSVPPRSPAAPPDIPNRPLGRAANKRLARLRRRLLGLE
jgi:hypothetical protein